MKVGTGTYPKWSSGDASQLYDIRSKKAREMTKGGSQVDEGQIGTEDAQWVQALHILYHTHSALAMYCNQ